MYNLDINLGRINLYNIEFSNPWTWYISPDSYRLMNEKEDIKKVALNAGTSHLDPAGVY